MPKKSELHPIETESLRKTPLEDRFRVKLTNLQSLNLGSKYKREGLDSPLSNNILLIILYLEMLAKNFSPNKSLMIPNTKRRPKKLQAVTKPPTQFQRYL